MTRLEFDGKKMYEIGKGRSSEDFAKMEKMLKFNINLSAPHN
jgi:hypothetical protein